MNVMMDKVDMKHQALLLIFNPQFLNSRQSEKNQMNLINI